MRKFAFFLAGSAALLLNACSTTATPTYGAHGNTAYRIECGGLFGDGDTGGCYQKAGDICMTQGYRILQTSTSSMIVECRVPGTTELDAAPSR